MRTAKHGVPLLVQQKLKGEKGGGGPRGHRWLVDRMFEKLQGRDDSTWLASHCLVPPTEVTPH